MTKRNERKGGDPFNPAFFSLSDFKKWMNHQQKDESPKRDIIGLKVESKISTRKLVARMETDDNAEELAVEFKENGGIVSEIDGNKLLIEVDSGSFIIHRMHVKRAC